MQEMREKLALTALLAALLVVLVWLGWVVASERRSNAPTRFADALWTMTHSLREEDR